MPVIPLIPVIVAGVSVALKGASMAKANSAAKASQALATNTAEYNAKVDEASATQDELDSTANIAVARQEAAIYTSRQQSAYASSGVLNSGSALAVEATTAGQMEQRIQQGKLQADQLAKQKRAEGAIGRLYGGAQAKAIGIENNAAMLRGGANLLSTVAGAYTSGIGSTAVPKGFAY